MGVILNGGRGPKRSQNFRDAMRRSAERRKCPKCNRKAAITVARDFVLRMRITTCRWCDFVEVKEMAR